MTAKADEQKTRRALSERMGKAFRLLLTLNPLSF